MTLHDIVKVTLTWMLLPQMKYTTMDMQFMSRTGWLKHHIVGHNLLTHS